MIQAGYQGIYLFSFDPEMNVKLLNKFVATFEATPFAYHGKIYIASRNVYLYSFGDKK